MPASESGGSSVQGKIQGRSQGAAKNNVVEMSPTSSTVTHSSPSTSRPSSNYSSRSTQLIGPQKGNLYLCCSKGTILYPA